jgi:2-iminobutanoate/2-iminopropanoate deaminase
MIKLFLLTSAFTLVAGSTFAQNVTRNAFPGGSKLLLESATINDKAQVVLVSGNIADPVNAAANPHDFGDTRTQMMSILGKIDAALKRQGMSIKDVVRLTIYVVEDPNLGKPDYAGMNAGYKMYFGTAENPGVVARSAFEIKGLQIPGAYLEVDAIAAR